jgi:hypothetical protein
MMPLLAPLIYRMSTEDVEYRFTAAQALAFCRHIRQTYSDLHADLPSQLALEAAVDLDPFHYHPSEYRELWSPGGKGWADIGCLSAE